MKRPRGSSIHIPSFAEIAQVSASRGMLSEAPDLWDGLVGWWPLQEGGGETAFDVSGNRNDGAFSAALDPSTDWIVTGRGHAVQTAGGTSNEYISHPSINFGTTYSVLLHMLDANTSSIHWGGQYNDYATYFATATTLYHKASGSSGSATVTNIAGSEHWVLTRAGSTTVLVYRNGKYDAAITLSGNTALILNTIGAFGNENLEAAAKYISVAGWSGRVLTPSEISRLYTDPWAMGRLRRRVFAVSGAAPPAGLSYWILQGRSQVIGGGAC